jgi:hypothetical protein
MHARSGTNFTPNVESLRRIGVGAYRQILRDRAYLVIRFP